MLRADLRLGTGTAQQWAVFYGDKGIGYNEGMETVKGFGIGVRAGAPLVALLGFVVFTNPHQLPSVLLVVPFLLVFMAVMALVMGATRALRQESGLIFGRQLRRPRVLAALLAAFPSLLLVLQSIGQLGLWDVITASALLLLAYIYVTRSSVSFFK